MPSTFCLPRYPARPASPGASENGTGVALGDGTGVGQMIVLGSEIKLGSNNIPHYNNVRPFLNRFGTNVPPYFLAERRKRGKREMRGFLVVVTLLFMH